ncbi:hypothetical protein BGZ83_003659 [Gryganskiella cystojenkinii]|nr:hypothetical protein BGZ83_003659 [Gryganskiella cystojenkinii]
MRTYTKKRTDTTTATNDGQVSTTNDKNELRIGTLFHPPKRQSFLTAQTKPSSTSSSTSSSAKKMHKKSSKNKKLSQEQSIRVFDIVKPLRVTSRKKTNVDITTGTSKAATNSKKETDNAKSNHDEEFDSLFGGARGPTQSKRRRRLVRVASELDRNQKKQPQQQQRNTRKKNGQISGSHVRDKKQRGLASRQQNDGEMEEDCLDLSDKIGHFDKRSDDDMNLRFDQSLPLELDSQIRRSWELSSDQGDDHDDLEPVFPSELMRTRGRGGLWWRKEKTPLPGSIPDKLFSKGL